jgi:acyl transferase domain-containing protein/NAD(P)H-dependent flavin oxidoreductase YrpB (nitropropane dioxygenase family)
VREGSAVNRDDARMTPMRIPGAIALTPPTLADPSIAIAASRAGALGILDLEYLGDETLADQAIDALTRHARGGWGVKLPGEANAPVSRILARLPEHLTAVLFTAGTAESLEEHVRGLRQRGTVVLLEATCLEQAELGEALGVDGLVVKGHEAGGRIGEETTFILLQRILPRVSLRVWAQGGIGLHTAAACHAAGAAGVVLDVQLALTRESPLPETVKSILARLDGGETTVLGAEIGEAYRFYARPGQPVVEELRRIADSLTGDSRPRPEILEAWHRAVRERAGWGAPEQHLWLLGQDVAFAAPLARRFRTVGGILLGLQEAVACHVQVAKRLRPLDEGAALAQSHRTRYPIVQGPMTRVSDVPAFAARVAEAGALPFLALALLHAPEVRTLLEETRRLLTDRPWGAGILGFVPAELRQEQLEAIRACPPPFALIAGGRPDQAQVLEQDGIPTYLHVPSPGLLQMFLENGSRRFVFEGRECGGHVGPRPSFVLWESMIDVLLERLPAAALADCHVLFAGGIHDALSASMVACTAAPLVERGVRIGVLLGTAYLFTEEAVTTGAVVPGFQQEAVRCTRTVLLETGPGHASRCVDTPFAATFERERGRLVGEGRPPEEIREHLEDLNLGRLRIAAKGIARHARYGQASDVPKFVTLLEDEQRTEGLYMVGQVAALRDRILTLEALHREVAVQGSDRLAQLPEPETAQGSGPRDQTPCDIAIIGMACLLPKAEDIETYWENILNKVDAITEIPSDRWDWRRYFDPDQRARDKINSKWGGFLDPIPFDPARYGMPPASLASIEPLQLLTLEVARRAVQDAGYADRPFPRERTAVILGTGGVADLGAQYSFRSFLPSYLPAIPHEVLSQLPEWSEDSFAGILLNVAAGRIANRLDLGAVNYTVDAACASSLAAVYLATRELESGASDLAIVGGADTLQSPFAYLCFSKTQALSPRGRCRTFDENADGIVISEGVAVMVMKRLRDAERDGDRIYAVIKGTGGSSDGRDKGLTAPRPEGQARALERAYAKAGFSPASVGLIEAHGTGTVAGDRAEVETLKRVFVPAGACPQSCAIGSVKSMIGHTKCTAGVAGLIKVALALHHKVLPPTMGVDRPNASLAGSPLYVNTETRPWIEPAADHPRRAGVSAFGFGGTNFHAVLEEYTGDFRQSSAPAPCQSWPSELLLWTGASREEIVAALERLEQDLEAEARPALADLAFSLWARARQRSSVAGQPWLHLAVVAMSLTDLRQKLALARAALMKSEAAAIQDPRGIYFSPEPLARQGRVAFLFPGQGSQYPDMLRELVIHFPEVRERFERTDRALAGRFPLPLSTYVFPPPRFGQDEERAAQQALTQTNVAQPALGAAAVGLFHLLQALGIRPDMVAGHSYGEYAALCAAGVFDETTLYQLSEARGRFIVEGAGGELGTMAAAEAGADGLKEALHSVQGVWIANLNGPRQTILSGTKAGVEEAIRNLEARGIRTRALPVACAFHSPLMAPARDRLAALFSTLTFSEPRVAVYANTTAAAYPQDAAAMVQLLGDHLVRPVAFLDEIEAMYQAGARIFVEVGPRNVLTGLAQQILQGRPLASVALDMPGRSGLLQLQHALGQLAAQGVAVLLDRLFQGRAVRQLNLDALAEESREQPVPPTTWFVNGSRARPLRRQVGGDASMSSPRQEPHPSPVPALTLPIAAAPAAGSGTPAPILRVTEALPPAASPAATAGLVHGSPDGEAAQVMLQFQRLMSRFLDTQQQVMLAYLRGTSDDVEGEARVALPARTPDVSLEPAPVPTASLPLSASSPLLQEGAAQPESSSPAADVSTVSPEGPASPDRPTPEEPGPPADREHLQGQLLQIVSERTGYPPEMLALDLNIEADLGIDSIKRVEILGALQRVYGISDWGGGQTAMEELTRLKTLRAIIDWISNALQSQPGNRTGELVLEQGQRAAAQASGQGDNTGAEVPRFLLTAVDAQSGNRG